MSTTQEKTCAACGGTIIELVGDEFCSIACRKAGRAFCKFCSNPIKDPYPTKKYCSRKCRERFSRLGCTPDPRNLSYEGPQTCLTCSKPLSKRKHGMHRQFCNNICRDRYTYAYKRNQGLNQEFGAFAPETRKALQQVTDSGMPMLAKRLAVAIHQEYTFRTPHDKRPPEFTIHCVCKVCNKEFKRRRWSHQSREYCSNICYYQAVKDTKPHLSWETVDEVRSLHASGCYSLRKLARLFGVSPTSIKFAITYQTWKPENDPRRKAQS